MGGAANPAALWRISTSITFSHEVCWGDDSEENLIMLRAQCHQRLYAVKRPRYRWVIDNCGLSKLIEFAVITA